MAIDYISMTIVMTMKSNWTELHCLDHHDKISIKKIAVYCKFENSDDKWMVVVYFIKLSMDIIAMDFMGYNYELFRIFV